MADVLSMALFEQKGRVLVVRKKAGAKLFPSMWLLPATVVASEDSAEEALGGHAFRDLNVQTGRLEFVETLSVVDEADGLRHVANVFKVVGYEGDLRFRAASDYADARWLTSDELSGISMPKALVDWLQSGRFKAAEPAPMPIVASETPPDNRSAWNTISRAYQDRYQISTESLEWGPRCSESDVQVLGDVSGKRVIVIGCGGGQDCIVLAKQGAQVIGIDLSDKQVEYGRRLADREDVLVTLMQGNAEQLKEIDDESQDLAVSAHALNYVERAGRALSEAFRVLRPGSRFVFSVGHPFRACLEDGPPYGVQKGYWEAQQDWQWEFPEKHATARFRTWYRPVSEWFSLLTDAGFGVDRMLEPPPVQEGESTWDGSYDQEKMRLIPTTLIFEAKKP
ncbi:MAG: methyltransferase domain-containing protein [Chloroflexi bacterium]|nr:methyltransferase domain-containing protein [Chloroflexota bacterium]